MPSGFGAFAAIAGNALNPGKVAETIRMRPAGFGTVLHPFFGLSGYRRSLNGEQPNRLTRSAGGNAMNLDVNTLFLVTIYVEAMLGLLLLFAWVQNSAITAVAWWGSAHLLRAASVVLFGLYGQAPDWVSIDLSNAILFTAFAVTWIGARVFDGRSPSYIGLFGGAVLWLVVCRIPVIAHSMEARILISSFIITGYTWAAAYEFWCGRSEPLVSRWPAIFMLFAHGSLFLLRTPLAAVLPWIPDSQVFESVWLTVLSFEALLFTIAIAFILLAMAKERTELLHKTASLVDPLTGIPNRRAFLEGTAMMARQIDADPKPAAVLLIDLDHFKAINDSFGHALGDRVLQVFAETAHANIGPYDLLGRLGGEEFAIALYDVDRKRALEIAETVRQSFEAVASEVDGHPVGATCSVGVAVSEDGPLDMSELLGQADQALYSAKERGRNRCEVATVEFILHLDASTPSLRINEMHAKPAA
jgi:diguanylate cyclase (GGDEF)-like protein